MCRLFGLTAGDNRVRATFWLLDAPDSLEVQSQRNADGAGLGYFGPDGEIVLDKQPESAFRDQEFQRAARQADSSAFVAHIRQAQDCTSAARRPLCTRRPWRTSPRSSSPPRNSTGKPAGGCSSQASWYTSGAISAWNPGSPSRKRLRTWCHCRRIIRTSTFEFHAGNDKCQALTWHFSFVAPTGFEPALPP